MKKYIFLKDFLGMKKGDIYEFDVEVEVYMGPLIEAGIIEEVKPKPKNRFLLKAEDIEYGTKYWYITAQNETIESTWTNDVYDKMRLANNNIFLIKEEAEAQAKRNEAVTKYLKCVARHNEARGFVAKFDEKRQKKCLFHVRCGVIHSDVWDFAQSYPICYYFIFDDAEAIRKELGDECLMLVFGGK